MAWYQIGNKLEFLTQFPVFQSVCSSQYLAWWSPKQPGIRIIFIKIRSLHLNIGNHHFGKTMSLNWVGADGPLTRYVKLRIAHSPGMPGTFSRPPTSKKLLVSNPDMHHITCVTHVPWCTSGSLTPHGGENVPGIPGACATPNFTYLARGPWWNGSNQVHWWPNLPNLVRKESSSSS